jgi:hypothetical protein
VALRKAAKRQHDANYRFNQAGGGADKQLVADGGPGSDGAAQRVAMEAEKQREYGARSRIKQRAKHPCLQSNRDRMNASGYVLLAKQQEEFRAWHRHWVSEWRTLEGQTFVLSPMRFVISC